MSLKPSTGEFADALRRLLDASSAYASAAHQHHEASFFDDEDEMKKANKLGERRYSQLKDAQEKARSLLQLLDRK